MLFKYSLQGTPAKRENSVLLATTLRLDLFAKYKEVYSTDYFDPYSIVIVPCHSFAFLTSHLHWLSLKRLDTVNSCVLTLTPWAAGQCKGLSLLIMKAPQEPK
jgi:hypothetical protein